MPKPFTERERKLIGERLMTHGARLFSSLGLRKTGVAELAAAAGISKAAFYLFYPSKEALFMEVVEQAERDFRREVLAVIDLPGPTPRARLAAVLRKAFSLWKTIPVLQGFTRSDFELVSRRVQPESFEEHLRSDQDFMHELIERSRRAGIPICIQPEMLAGLAYTLFFVILHENDLGQGALAGPLEVLLELVAAYCLGEIDGPIPGLVQGGQIESGD